MCVPEILLPFFPINEASLLFVVRCYLIITRIMTYTQVIGITIKNMFSFYPIITNFIGFLVSDKPTYYLLKTVQYA